MNPAQGRAATGREPPRRVDEPPLGTSPGVDIDIRIARDGTWYHEGRPIRRPALVRLFAGILRRDAGGDYVLVTPAERRRIRVDDAPFVAVEVTRTGTPRGSGLTFRTNVGERVTAGPDHPIRVDIDPDTGEPSPYVTIREGIEALICRSVYYELVALGSIARLDGRDTLVLRSLGRTFVLGPVDDDRG